MLIAVLFFAAATPTIAGNPYQNFFSSLLHSQKPAHGHLLDIQGHRGGRANVVENTLPSFAWGLIDGAMTLEMDNGLTKDGAVVVWHDNDILSSKCRDTQPAFPNDPMYPYVGKYIANLTLAQVKSLDCGSIRQPEFPRQLTYPGTRISTLQEVFDFLDCADPRHDILMNIESKIDPLHPNHTLHVRDFVEKQHAVFSASQYYRSITYQSFDWRTLIAMKRLDPVILTSALVDDTTVFVPGHNVSPWLGGVDLQKFNGSTLGARLAQATHSIKADILSPIAIPENSLAVDPQMPGYQLFTTPEMVAAAHDLGVKVKPWTVNRLSIADQLLDFGVDGIITDVPDTLRRWAQQKKLPVAPRYPKYSVLECLAKHNQIS